MAEDVPMGALDVTPDWRGQEAQLGLDLQRQYEARQAAPKSSWYDTLSTAARTPGRVLGALTASPASPEADQAAMMPETYVSPLVKNTMDAIGGAVKSGITAPGRALSGEMPMIDPETGHTSAAAIQGAFDTAALAGGGAAAKASEQLGGRLYVSPAKEVASTLASDTAKPGAAVAAAEHTPPFYSALERAVAEHPQEKMTGEEWARMLANKPGVKKEEMQFTGTHDLLKDAKLAPITKDQLLDHLNENRVQIGEVTKGGEEKPWRELPGDRQWELVDRWGVPPSQAEDVYEGLRAKGELSDTRYGSYVLPGGENYREKLLTLPPRGMDPEAFAKQFYDTWIRKGGEPEWESLSKAKQEDLMRIAGDQGVVGKSPDDYKSSHWDEPNVLLHMRMSDRPVLGAGEDAAKKALHLEELQSDWHQQGRQKGYGNPAQDNFEKIKAELLQKHGVDSLIPLRGVANKSPELAADLRRLDEAYQAAQVEKHQGMPVPDAPFKKTWHELGLKRALHEAAEGGYDRLSWTPGEAQAARYDLSKQVDALHYRKNPDGTFTVSAQVQRRGHPLGDKLTEQQLADQVGKDVTEKIIKGEGIKRNFGGNSTSQPPDYWNELSGDGLKVGGEGMKGFYDKMIPDYLNKVGKPYGVKVQKGATAGGDGFGVYDRGGNLIQEFKTASEAHHWDMMHPVLGGGREIKQKTGTAPVHYMDIPPSLKQQLLTKGMPLFEDSSAGEGIAAAQESSKDKQRSPKGRF